MNIQAHMSGQMSGQVPNQARSQLSGLPQQNGSSLLESQYSILRIDDLYMLVFLL